MMSMRFVDSSTRHQGPGEAPGRLGRPAQSQATPLANFAEAETAQRQQTTPQRPDGPYRGLEVFDEAHAPYFFGRDALTQHLVEALRDTRFLAVLGPSGSGKSSLVRAGLLPQLRGGGDHFERPVALPGDQTGAASLLKRSPSP